MQDFCIVGETDTYLKTNKQYKKFLHVSCEVKVVHAIFFLV